MKPLTDIAKSELTQLLWAELSLLVQSEEKIRQLVGDGADISGDFLETAIMCVRPPHVQEETGKKGLDIKWVMLLIELGADMDYHDEDEFNCLWDAGDVWHPELLEFMLKRGANPNCISFGESLLDWFISDRWHEESTWGNSRKGLEPIAKVIELLKQYGAKHTSELLPSNIQ